MSLFKNPGESDYDVLVAENGFIHDIQLAIESALEANKMTQSELAAALDVSPARVSQMLADNGRNLRARTIARVAHAVGRKPFIDFVEEASSWVSAEVVEEHPADQHEFAAWVTAACRVLDASAEMGNDNGWTPPDAPVACEMLVAA